MALGICSRGYNGGVLNLITLKLCILIETRVNVFDFTHHQRVSDIG